MNYPRPPVTNKQTESQVRRLAIFEEFRHSAVPNRLTAANVRYIEGDEAVESLSDFAVVKSQKSTSFVGAAAQQILERYEFVRAGAWAVWGTTLDGDMGGVAIVKPRNPRADIQKLGKRIKYETPAAAPAVPILPYVDAETAAAIYQRYEATPLAGETFWQVVQRCNLPLAIAEGVKKALALLAHGLPAIAIRGITQWHKKGTNELHQAIADFATAKRDVYIVFDQDEKPSTRQAVRQQALKLALGLETRGCKALFLLWDGKLGKGIDDCLFKQGSDAQAWFNNLLANASTLKALQRDARTQKALDIIARLNRLSYPVERATTGEYLPALPELEQGAIHVLSASMNAGKTTRIGQDWVQSATTQGWNVLVIVPLNSLGDQTATDWNLPHIHGYGTTPDQQESLWRDVSYRHGIVMCANSLHRLPDWFYDRPVLLVLDEANQAIDDLSQGNTLATQFRFQMIWERFALAARHALATGAIVLSEDGIPDRAVNLVKTIANAEKVRVFTHQKQGIPWDCVVYHGKVSAFRKLLLSTSGKLLFVTTSQLEGRRLERALRGSDRCKVIRIDSETNEAGQFTAFFENPDQWLAMHQPDVLILSPSAKSGISIQGGVGVASAYFDRVYGYLTGLTTDIQTQLLGRFRPAVPRVIFCPEFASPNSVSGDEAYQNPRAIKRRLHSNAQQFAGVYGLSELLEAPDDRAELMSTVETAVLEYYAAARAVAGAQKSIMHLALTQRLEAAGHNVTSMKLTEGCDEVGELWQQIQEELWREDAAAIAAAEVKPEEHTPEWARGILGALASTLAMRILARKVLWRDEFPGILFDCPEECYRALCEDYGAMRRGVRAQAKAENLEGTLEADRSAMEAIFKGSIRALHRLPKNYAQAMLRAKSGVLELLDGTPYSNKDPRAIAVKTFALKFAQQIYYFLRLTIKADQTPVEICHKLLAQFGLESDKENRPGAIIATRPGKRGEQSNRVYAVNLEFDPLRVRLLEAAQRKLSEFVSTTRNRDTDTPIRVMDTSLPNSDSGGYSAAAWAGVRVKWGSRLGEWVVEAVDGTTARVRAAAGWAGGMVWSASVSDLRAAA